MKLDEEWVWVIIVDGNNGIKINRVFTDEEDARNYAKDYNKYVPFIASVEKRKLNKHYIGWRNRDV